MQQLNFPVYQFNIKSKENKLFIFDIIRKKYVYLSPEEWVRQHCLHYVTTNLGYPASLIAIEKQLTVNSLKKRTDILVYDANAHPHIIVECKAPEVDIKQHTFDQIARYNLSIKAKYLMVTNGLNHYFCNLDYEKETYVFLKEIPPFSN